MRSRKRLSIAALLLLLGAVAWSAPAPVLAQEGTPPLAVGVSFDYYPRRAAVQSSNNEAPVSARITISGLDAGKYYRYYVRLLSGSTEVGSWYTGSSWGTGYRSLGTGNTAVSLWAYLRLTAPPSGKAYGDTVALQARVQECSDASCSSGTAVPGSPFASTADLVLLDSATTCTSNCAGWIREDASPAAAGDMIVVKDGATLIGVYRASSGSGAGNSSWPGYPPYNGSGGTTDGYYKIPVPACGTCNYTIERWDYDSPDGSARDGTQVNSMPDIHGSNSVAAGSTTMLQFGTPTAVTFRSLSARASAAPWALPALVVAISGGAAIRRRRQA